MFRCGRVQPNPFNNSKNFHNKRLVRNWPNPFETQPLPDCQCTACWSGRRGVFAQRGLTRGLMDLPRLFIAAHRHVGAPFTEWPVSYKSLLAFWDHSPSILLCYSTHCTRPQIGFCLVMWRGSVYVISSWHNVRRCHNHRAILQREYQLSVGSETTQTQSMATFICT